MIRKNCGENLIGNLCLPGMRIAMKIRIGGGWYRVIKPQNKTKWQLKKTPPFYWQFIFNRVLLTKHALKKF